MARVDLIRELNDPARGVTGVDILSYTIVSLSRNFEAHDRQMLVQILGRHPQNP